MPGSIKKMLTVVACLAALGCFAMSVGTAYAQAPAGETSTMTKAPKAKKAKAEKAKAEKTPKAKKAKKAKEPKTSM
jgi:hypothetical protein